MKYVDKTDEYNASKCIHDVYIMYPRCIQSVSVV